MPLLSLVALLAFPAPDGPARFKADVAPILARRCLGCHNDAKSANGLNMSTVALLRKGGKAHGAEILVAGDAGASYLVECLKPDAEPRMPHKLPPLADAEIALVERWVSEGAKLDGVAEAASLASIVDPLAGLPAVAVTVAASAPVSAIAYLPDGRTLAAAVGGEVLLVDVASRKQVGALGGLPGPATSIQVPADGRSLVAAGGRPGQFGSVTIWDLGSRAMRHDLRGHADSILGASLSPDGKLLATAGYDRLVKLWDVAAGIEVRTLKEHTDAVHAVAFSPDGRRLASAGADRTLKVWEAATGRKIATYADATAELFAVAFAPDGRTVLAGGADRSIRAWSVGEGPAGAPRSAFAHDGGVLKLVASADGRTLVSAGEDRAVKLWDLSTLKARATLGGQPDWPLAIAAGPAGGVAVGRYDGSISVYGDDGARVDLRDAPKPAPPPKPALSFAPTLNAPAPRGGRRGTTQRVTLTGSGVGRPVAVIASGDGITAEIASGVAGEDKLDVDLVIAPSASQGIRTLRVRTPRGMTPGVPFDVSDLPDVGLAEPDDIAAESKLRSLPAVLVGAIDRPGDLDHARFELKAGQTLAVDLLARPLGSMLVPRLSLIDAGGTTVAEGATRIIHGCTSDGIYTLRVVDADFAGSGAHFYRVHVGILPIVEGLWPLGVEAGKSSRVVGRGANLGDDPPVLVDATGPGDLPRVVDAPRPRIQGVEAIAVDRKLVVAEGPQGVDAAGSSVGNPGGVSGVIAADGEADVYRFEGRKGVPVVVEVYGRRLGSPIDAALEILDDRGRPIPRAVLRPVAETAVAFRDHPATGRGVRLTRWDELKVDDLLLVGRELTRLAELPRNPDDDAVFWGTGEGHGGGGGARRVGLLETTPEHHPMGQPVYKVEVHPPGATFPAGGTPPTTLYYRNDDGGPGLGKDPRVTFVPPADGVYLARVQDARGLGSSSTDYHLVVRPPRPDFRVTLSTENPNVPRGGRSLVTAAVERIDGHDEPIDLEVIGLPDGLRASPARIEAGMFAADFTLWADADAPAFGPATWAVSACSGAITRAIDPGGASSGYITVVATPNLSTLARVDRVEITPGGTAELTLAVERGPAFAGRVPIEVRNLPRGVRVLNVGLSGVLVTERQVERTITLFAEPWAAPGERPFYAVGKCEAAGGEHPSGPITLVVRSAPRLSP